MHWDIVEDESPSVSSSSSPPPTFSDYDADSETSDVQCYDEFDRDESDGDFADDKNADYDSVNDSADDHSPNHDTTFTDFYEPTSDDESDDPLVSSHSPSHDTTFTDFYEPTSDNQSDDFVDMYDELINWDASDSEVEAYLRGQAQWQQLIISFALIILVIHAVIQ